jgi:MFS family permease
VRDRTRALAAPLRSATFRRFWLAGVLTELGDWAARLALAVLVYDESGSAALTGLVTAVGLLAWVGPGQLLSTLADRTSRRAVLVGCDLVRAAAFAVAALGVPLPVLLALVFAAGLATPPAEAAAAAVRPTLVPEAQVPAVHTLTGVAGDSALLLGSVLGGVLVATLGAPGALGFNAATFVLSAWLLFGVPCPTPRDRAPALLRRAARTLWTIPDVRRAALLATAAMGSATGATAMLAPYVLGELGRGAGSTAALGGVAGAVTIVLTLTVVPHVPDRGAQLRVIGMLGGLGAALLCLLALPPVLPLVLLAVAGVGALSVVIVPASALVGPLLPDEVRASAFSVLMGVTSAAQALAAVVAGALAEVAGTGPAVALVALPTVAVCLWHLCVPRSRRGARRLRVLHPPVAPAEQEAVRV